MAYKTLLTGQSKALLLTKKGQAIEGHLVAAETKVGKFDSTILTFETGVGPVKVWSNKRIDSALLDEKGRTLHPSVAGCMVRLTCTDVRKEKKGKKMVEYRDYKVECDTENKLNGRGKTYQLKLRKSFIK